jgi:DNA-binding CsgD family transcriptional regulator/sugar-specific transcriptional regulator TrmB
MPTGTTIEVPTLIGLGMPESAAQLWKAMLEAPGADVDDLAALLGIPETAVRTGLDELADLALVRASRQTPHRLVPIAAQAGTQLLLRAQEAELDAHRRALEARRDEITQTLAANLPTDQTPDPSGQIEHLTRPDAIHARFEHLAYTTTECTDTLMPVAAIPAEALADARPLDAELLHRGVQTRMLYLEAIRNDAPTIAYARNMADLGAAVRTAPTLPQRLFVSDRRIALLPLDPTTRGRGVVCVSAPGVIASLLDLFDSIWRHAAPLDVGNPVDAATGLTDTERELLALLADGATDETAAKRLGVSLRTVRRIMAELMNRLQASSRFEAGIKAAKNGWL